MRTTKLKRLQKLHKVAIHTTIIDDKDWYRLNRRETKEIQKLNSVEAAQVCRKCF